MSDNYQPLLQYVEHDLEEVQWHDDIGDSTTNYQFPMMPSQEPRFLQKLDVFHQQGPGKYLRHERMSVHKNTAKIQGGFKEPYIATSHRRTQRYQQERSRIPQDAQFWPPDPTLYPQERISVSSSRKICWPCPKKSLPDTSSKINALRGPKSSTNIQCIGKKSEEAKEPRSRTHWQATSRDHDSAIHQRVQAGSQKRGKENNSET
jgi:hypothetical protein